MSFLVPRPFQLEVCAVWHGESESAVKTGQILDPDKTSKKQKQKNEVLCSLMSCWFVCVVCVFPIKHSHVCSAVELVFFYLFVFVFMLL